jgi:hypothetical protein
MAKKKRKKQRRPQSASSAPAGATATTTEERTATRQERKEQARKERERRIREARRRQRMRKAARWGAAALVVALVGGGIWYLGREGRRLQDAAQAAAGRLSCSDTRTLEDLGRSHQPPFQEGRNGVPAASGAHSSPLPADPPVYDQPIPEANAIHNLEHGYVILYYADGGDNALPEGIRTALEELVRDEEKVLMAPYPDLASPLDLVAWRTLRTCDPPEDADPDDAVTVARAFIEEFRSGGLAPEPNLP